jgi:hypothetical protein
MKGWSSGNPMATTVREIFGSRERSEAFAAGSSSLTLLYWVEGTTDDDVAESALRTELPPSFRALPLRSWKCDPLGHELWLGKGSYSDRTAPEPPDLGEAKFSFDTTGGTQKITQSYATSSYAPVGETAPDFKQAIGVSDGKVEGVDIVLPQLKFSLNYRKPQADLTLTYVNTLFSLTGKYNNASFRGFSAGELLFAGAVGSEGTVQDPEITFHFIASPNVTNLSIGNGITVTSKLGHEYLWVYYEPAEDATAKRLVQNPIAAYVERVIEPGNFALLGIGV